MHPDWLHAFLDVPRINWEAALEFWPAATGTTLSSHRGEDNQFVTLLPHSGRPWLKMQAIDDTEPRIHLDLDAPDREAAVRASEALGATPAWRYHDVVVMHSPGGVLFCHTLGDEPRASIHDERGPEGRVRLDVPARLWDAELAFWTGRTGSGHIETRRHDKAARVTAHLDLVVDDPLAEAARHLALGAERTADDDRGIALRAPSGHVYRLVGR